MKRVLIIAREFPPTGGAGVQRITKFVKYLPEFGWEPVVLCADHEKGKPQDHTLLHDLSPSVEIVRIPAPQFSKLHSSRIGRAILRLFLIPDENIVWARRALPVAVELAQSVDMILSTDPPSAHWLGYQVKGRTAKPWVMDIRDLWTLAFTYRPASWFHGKADQLIEEKLLTKADGIVCATEGYKQELMNTYPSLKSDIFSVIPNGYDEADFKGKERKRDEYFRLTYVGAIFDFSVRPRPTGWKRFLEPVLSGGPPEMVRSPAPIIEAVQLIQENQPELFLKIRIRFVGKFPEDYLKEIQFKGLEEVFEIDGYVNHDEAIQAMLDADVLFLMQSGTGSECVIPGKLYEYLYSETPILGLFPDGLAPRIINKTQTGITLEPHKINELHDTIVKWFYDWSSGREITRPILSEIQEFSRRDQTKQLATIFNNLM